MQNIKETWVYRGLQGRRFLICNVDDGRDFADPLILFARDDYDIHNINEEGLYAVGGKINIETLLSSYKWGIFPWFAYRYHDKPRWYCPRERFVINPDNVHISHSLRTLLNKNRYHVTINKEFSRVISNCKKVNGRDEDDGAWLGETIERIFIELYEKGFAKSVEVWEGDKLVGGFYGFWNKGIFQGESMFSLQPSASQIGLVLLCKNPFIDGIKIKLIDTQFETTTFKRLGGSYITYEEYREIMDK